MSRSDPNLTPRWQAMGWPDLAQRTWEGEVFAYNRLTGDTQVLNAAAVAALDALTATPLSATELAARLGLNPDQDLPSLQAHLDHLALTCLIEPVTPSLPIT